MKGGILPNDESGTEAGLCVLAALSRPVCSVSWTSGPDIAENQGVHKTNGGWRWVRIRPVKELPTAHTKESLFY